MWTRSWRRRIADMQLMETPIAGTALADKRIVDAQLAETRIADEGDSLS